MQIRVSTGHHPRPQQRLLHAATGRFKVLVTHRRFGKTVFAVNELISRAKDCKRMQPRFAYLAPFHIQAKDVAWSYLKHYTAKIPEVKVNETELWVELPARADHEPGDGGARIRLYGADNADRLRGLYFDGVVLDEYAQMHPRVWSEVVRPALADRQGWALFIGTPMGRNGFCDLFEGARDGFATDDGARQRDLDWAAFMFKASETGIIPASELEAARRAMTPDQYAQEFECSFDAAIAGAYYAQILGEAERLGRVRPIAHEPSLPVHTGWDLGIGDPLPADTLEGGFDRAVMRDQQLRDATARALTFPVTVAPGVSGELPNPVADEFLRFSSDGQSIVSSPIAALGAVGQASETVAGIGEIATDAEMTAGTAGKLADAEKVKTSVDAKIAAVEAEVTAVEATIEASSARNRVLNPGFMIDQRVHSATSRADDTYCVDGFYVLTEANPITVTRQTDQEDGHPSSIRLTQSNASAQRMGLAQIISVADCKDLWNEVAAFRARARLSTSANLRYAILGWAGTADSVTSDVVNDWTNATYTAGNFFNATTLSVLAVAQQAMTAATFADLAVLSVNLGSAFNNIILFAWTEGTVAQNVTVDLGKMQFAKGATLKPFEYPDRATELVKCRLRLRPITQMPAININATTAVMSSRLDPPMLGTPTNTLGISTLTMAGVGAVGSLSGFTVNLLTAELLYTSVSHASAGATGTPGYAVLTGEISTEL